MSILCPTVISGEYFIPDTIAGFKENRRKENRMKEAGIVYAIQKIIASTRWNTIHNIEKAIIRREKIATNAAKVDPIHR